MCAGVAVLPDNLLGTIDLYLQLMNVCCPVSCSQAFCTLFSFRFDQGCLGLSMLLSHKLYQMLAVKRWMYSQCSLKHTA